MSTNAELITELRSAAATLRTPTGTLLPAQDRITAELLERSADALNHVPPSSLVDAEGLNADEKDVAVAQAVEFAQYVEQQAKGTMRDAARRFLSLPYSAQIAERLGRSVSQHAAPAWSEFPAWVNFIAMDSDGRWHGFGREPYVEDSFGGNLMGWDVIDGGSMAYRDYNAPHVAGWRESMQKRPAPTVSIRVDGAPLSAEQKANILSQLEREGLS